MQALEQKKLFVLDYHDLLLPFVHKVRELEGTTLYGSRTIFFLTRDGTLKPIVIELTRPASPSKPQWKRAFTRCSDATGSWLWNLAKAHVCSHDSGYHELVSHWYKDLYLKLFFFHCILYSLVSFISCNLNCEYPSSCFMTRQAKNSLLHRAICDRTESPT